MGQRTPAEGRQRQVTIQRYIAHGRSPALGLNPTKASRTHAGLFRKPDGYMGIMNVNKHLIEAAAYLIKRSGNIGIKCLPTEMACFSSPKNIATLKKPTLG